MSMTFEELFLKVCKPTSRFRSAAKYRLLCLDPGETTGWSLFQIEGDKVTLFSWGQIKTWPLEEAVLNYSSLFMGIDEIVFESYQVYSWKTEQHTFSDVPTIQIIGCLKTLCIQQGIPYSTQTAQVAKGFVTDEKLEAWGFWQAGQKHARDSIRHGCYKLVFGDSQQKTKK